MDKAGLIKRISKIKYKYLPQFSFVHVGKELRTLFHQFFFQITYGSKNFGTFTTDLFEPISMKINLMANCLFEAMQRLFHVRNERSLLHIQRFIKKMSSWCVVLRVSAGRFKKNTESTKKSGKLLRNIVFSYYCNVLARTTHTQTLNYVCHSQWCQVLNFPSFDLNAKAESHESLLLLAHLETIFVSFQRDLQTNKSKYRGFTYFVTAHFYR